MARRADKDEPADAGQEDSGPSLLRAASPAHGGARVVVLPDPADRPDVMAIAGTEGRTPCWLVDMGKLGQIEVRRDGKNATLGLRLNTDASGLRITELGASPTPCNCDTCRAKRRGLN